MIQGDTLEEQLDARTLGQAINAFLDTLSKEDRVLFVRRYWYGDEVKELAKKCGVSGPQMTQRMLRLRRKLQAFLTEKGVVL